jgi:hypothetical protein
MTHYSNAIVFALLANIYFVGFLVKSKKDTTILLVMLSIINFVLAALGI